MSWVEKYVFLGREEREERVGMKGRMFIGLLGVWEEVYKLLLNEGRKKYMFMVFSIFVGRMGKMVGGIFSKGGGGL